MQAARQGSRARNCSGSVFKPGRSESLRMERTAGVRVRDKCLVCRGACTGKAKGPGLLRRPCRACGRAYALWRAPRSEGGGGRGGGIHRCGAVRSNASRRLGLGGKLGAFQVSIAPCPLSDACGTLFLSPRDSDSTARALISGGQQRRAGRVCQRIPCPCSCRAATKQILPIMMEHEENKKENPGRHSAQRPCRKIRV